jgi:general secretion pathway protein A
MYNAFFEMNEEPFRLTPDPRFFHFADHYRDVLLKVVQGVLLRRGFIAVTGPVGIGKTTLLHAALQLISGTSFEKRPIATAFVVNPKLTRDEFFETLMDEFELSCASTSKPRRLAQLHAMFLEKQRRGGTSVLIIDEAHLLSVELFEEIRLLSNVDTYTEKLLQVVFAGQTEMMFKLDRPELRALKQRIACHCHIRSLSLAETRAYVSDRMKAAGLRGPSPFSRSAVEEIFRYTSGIPRLINLICESCLIIGFSTKRKEIGLDIVEDAASSLSLNRVTTLELPVTPAERVVTADSEPASELPMEGLNQRRTNFRE